MAVTRIESSKICLPFRIFLRPGRGSVCFKSFCEKVDRVYLVLVIALVDLCCTFFLLVFGMSPWG